MAPFPRLDTYQSERAPHVRKFIELAIRLGGSINTKSVEAGLAAGVRRENEPAKLEVKKPLLGPGLSAANTELTGQLAPQFALADGRRRDPLTEIAGQSWKQAQRIADADFRFLRFREARELLERFDMRHNGRFRSERVVVSD